MIPTANSHLVHDPEATDDTSFAFNCSRTETHAPQSKPVMHVSTMAKTMRFITGLLLLVTVFSVMPAHAYQLSGYKWPQPTTSFYVDISGKSGLYNTAFEGAMASWGAAGFDYTIFRDEYEDPCDPQEGRNGVAFNSSDCGEDWGSSTLAVCHTWYNLSSGKIIQTDIVFNTNNYTWGVYSGPKTSADYDFKRVAVHELGHALGLDHEDSGVATIMKSYAGNIQVPQQDDIDGVADIYGLISTVYAPSSISVPSGDADGSYAVNWGNSATSGVTYVLEEATSNGFTTGVREAYRGSSISASITGRSNEVIYFYRVKAVKSGSTDSAWVTGSNGCIVALSVSGDCGSANGMAATSKPATNLCFTGTASTVSGSGPWNWSCAGANGGSTASCSATVKSWTVTPSAGSNGALFPPTAQSVANNSTTNFTVTPDSGYQLFSITGCGGALSGSTYTSGPITGDCSVTASFSPLTAMARDGVVTAASDKNAPDISDALSVLKYSVNLISLTEAQLAHGDVAPLGSTGAPQGDGSVNISDALGILRRAVGLANW